MVAKQFAFLVLLSISCHIHGSPLSTEEAAQAQPAVPAPPAPSEPAVATETMKLPEDAEQKWIVPLISFALAPSPTTPAPRPGPPPQMIILPQNSTLSIVSQQPINLVQGQASTSYSANAPGPNPINLQTQGK